ncbi:MAG: hypothetical protein ACOX3Q_14785 [Clostridia bacterium]|jgi:cell shape-determining protein MreC
MRKICLWTVCIGLLFFIYSCSQTKNQDIAMYENQIKHMESEMEQLREENERLKKLLGETS